MKKNNKTSRKKRNIVEYSVSEIPTGRPGLSHLLRHEIAKNKKKEKTRPAEMFSIFASHNFYAGGLTPVELRTTLEDLGPTYVKIGQIMSSRLILRLQRP